MALKRTSANDAPPQTRSAIDHLWEDMERLERRIQEISERAAAEEAAEPEDPRDTTNQANPNPDDPWIFNDTVEFNGNVTLDGAVTLGSTVTFDGAVTFNSTTSGIDHGALDGLGDDDHTIYFLADGSRNLGGDVTPSADETHDIGSTAAKIAELHAWNRFPELILFDDFLSGNSGAAGSIGQLGWHGFTAGGGTASQTGGIAAHPGIIDITSGVTSSNLTSIYHEQTVYQIALQDIARADWYLSVDTAWPTAVRAQMTPNISASNPAGSVGFEALSGDTNWHAISTDGSGSTRTDTGVARAAATWTKLEIRWTAAQTFTFYINGSLVATHTGAGNNVPADSTVTQMTVNVVSDGTDRTVSVDRVRVFTNLER